MFLSGRRVVVVSRDWCFDEVARLAIAEFVDVGIEEPEVSKDRLLPSVS
jgi:hypothetical protein